ncbi:MAG: PQQ-dependent sugar dehydrogenase [Actinomycetota bacterium]|nr:PQQ-dependent sugar dehydrogenase [Actinomycetota bacterium]
MTGECYAAQVLHAGVAHVRISPVGRRRTLRTAWGGALAAVLLLVLAAGCAGEQQQPRTTPPPGVAVPQLAGDVARGLAVPWGLDFLPGGDALVTERDSARIVRVTPDGRVAPIGRVPQAESNGEGGLLGLAISPRFATDRLVYVYYSTPAENRIVRMTYENGRFGPAEPIITGIPSAVFHDGGRIVFGPDGMLYAGTGDATVGPLAQNRTSLAGKILRMTPDGEPAPGNPFPGSLVYSYGHRNVQGLAFDSQGRLWAAEHGKNRWDELNLIRPGGNYGWPLVEGRGGGGEFIQPAAQWRPDDASPSGIAIVDDVVYMAALRGRQLWQVPIRGDTAGDPVAYFTGELGRLRTVWPTPEGSLWLMTSNRDGRGEPRQGDDRIVRVQLQ